MMLPAVCAALVWAAGAALAWAVGAAPYPAWLAGGTIATVLLFTFDKRQAKNAGRRVPEVVLLALVLLGGVVGGWIGMLVVRHKTRHNIFWLVQWIATALHIALCWWLLRSYPVVLLG